MSEDKSEEWPEVDRYVENYFMVEFVAVPPDFEIGHYLTLREHTGIFDCDRVTLTNIKKIVEAIRYSPVVSLLNNALLNERVGLYLLSVLDDLGLILKTIPNPLRKDGVNHKDLLKRYNENSGKVDYIRPTNIRHQEAKRINIIIVNIFQMMSQNVIDEAMQIAKDIQVNQEKANKKLKPQ